VDSPVCKPPSWFATKTMTHNLQSCNLASETIPCLASFKIKPVMQFCFSLIKPFLKLLMPVLLHKQLRLPQMMYVSRSHRMLSHEEKVRNANSQCMLNDLRLLFSSRNVTVLDIKKSLFQLKLR
jgi:hypothetical protein